MVEAHLITNDTPPNDTFIHIMYPMIHSSNDISKDSNIPNTISLSNSASKQQTIYIDQSYSKHSTVINFIINVAEQSRFNLVRPAIGIGQLYIGTARESWTFVPNRRDRIHPNAYAKNRLDLYLSGSEIRRDTFSVSFFGIF